MTIGVCLKWVPRRPEVDRLSGAVHADDRFAGASAADQAALEWALQAGEAWGEPVLAVSAGPAEADGVLRDALACGAASVLRLDQQTWTGSPATAAVLAGALTGCDVVVCGDYSDDRGSGSVPAYLADHLGASQALGLVGLAFRADCSIEAIRRLDGGRRERLAVRPRAVLSVEGGTARLRRAALATTLQARRAEVPTRPGAPASAHEERRHRPFRPRARVLPPPAGDTARDRILAITHALSPPRATQRLELDPDAAAGAILDALARWGYRPPT